MKKSKQFAVSPQFPLSLFHKNKRWFFKSSVSAFLTSSYRLDQNYPPKPSGWELKTCYDFYLSSSPISKLMAHCVFSLFFYFSPLPWAKHCYYKNKSIEIPVLTKFGESCTHEKKHLCFSLWKWARWK
jgi:hypothetical protein